jgi:hypothetical protein
MTQISSPDFRGAIKVAETIAARHGVMLEPTADGTGFQGDEELPEARAAALRAELLVSRVRLTIGDERRLTLTPGQ